jgi:hypothetical protein
MSNSISVTTFCSASKAQLLADDAMNLPGFLYCMWLPEIYHSDDCGYLPGNMDDKILSRGRRATYVFNDAKSAVMFKLTI